MNVGLMMNRIKNSSYAINTIFNYIYKVFSMSITYITIPLTLSYLGDERYGVWQTILTIISWASLSNFGIGNGLRNKVTQSLSEHKYEKMRGYITSAYYYLTVISVIILIISIALILNIDTNILFKNNNLKHNEIIVSFIIIIFNFCLNFILGISSSIAFGIHKSSLVNFFQVISNMITLVGLIFITIFTNPSIVNVALIYLISNTASNIILTIYLFREHNYRPNKKYNNKLYGKELVSVGMEFFILQLASVILFSTDNFIISSFIGVKDVAEYSIINRLFQIVPTFFSILLTQLWSEVASAIYKNNYIWIKNTINKLLIVLIPSFIILLIMIIKFEFITKIWIGSSVYCDKKLIYLSAIYAWIICYNAIFVNVLNGMNELRIQTIISTISCIINIPIAITFIKIFNLGVTGVVLSNIICIGISAIVCSVYTFLKLNKS